MIALRRLRKRGISQVGGKPLPIVAGNMKRKGEIYLYKLDEHNLKVGMIYQSTGYVC